MNTTQAIPRNPQELKMDISFLAKLLFGGLRGDDYIQFTCLHTPSPTLQLATLNEQSRPAYKSDRDV
jgi:hypothetical protein